MSGCKERKCPCRLWVNCVNYVDAQRQMWRMKNRENSFANWYRDNFKLEIKMADVFGNG
jgi:hypothetical protein